MTERRFTGREVMAAMYGIPPELLKVDVATLRKLLLLVIEAQADPKRSRSVSLDMGDHSWFRATDGTWGRHDNPPTVGRAVNDLMDAFPDVFSAEVSMMDGTRTKTTRRYFSPSKPPPCPWCDDTLFDVKSGLLCNKCLDLPLVEPGPVP